MKRIYKYYLNQYATSTFLPAYQYFRPLHVEMLHDSSGIPGIYLWAMVDTDSTPIQQEIRVYMTGLDLPANMSLEQWYISSAWDKNLNNDYHVFHMINRRTENQ